jgi:hypothetical protein
MVGLLEGYKMMKYSLNGLVIVVSSWGWQRVMLVQLVVGGNEVVTAKGNSFF